MRTVHYYHIINFNQTNLLILIGSYRFTIDFILLFLTNFNITISHFAFQFFFNLNKLLIGLMTNFILSMASNFNFVKEF